MTLYRRPKFLEILHEIREEMSREVDYDIDLFAETVRTGKRRKTENSDGEFSIFNPLTFEQLTKTEMQIPKHRI